MAELHKLKDYATVYTLKVLLLVPFSTRPQEFPQLGNFLQVSSHWLCLAWEVCEK